MAIRYIEAFSDKYESIYDPTQALPNEISVFLAGGITGCYNWQKEMFDILNSTPDVNLTLLNPRRENWPENDPEATTEQIKWEFEHLQKADTIVFWFPPETLCPITLFEFGKWLSKSSGPLAVRKPLFVGCHPEYKRLLDVQVQTKLERPFMNIHTDIQSVVNDVVSYEKEIREIGDQFRYE